MADPTMLQDLQRLIDGVKGNATATDADSLAKVIDLQSKLEELKQKRQDEVRRGHLVSSPWFTAIMSPILGAMVGVGGFYLQARVNEKRVVTEQRQRDRELANAERASDRDWRLKAMDFFASNRAVLFGPPTAEQDALINTIIVVFPPEITGPMFARARSTNASPGTIAKLDSASARVGVPRLEGVVATERLLVRIVRQSGTNADGADQLRAALTSAGVMPGAVTMQDQPSASQLPGQSEVRFYYPTDSSNAIAVNRFLTNALGLDSRLNARLDANQRSAHKPGELHVYLVR